MENSREEPALTSDKLIDKLCESVYLNNKLSNKDLWERNLLIKNLQSYLVKFRPEIRLSLYGSMRSGLALRTSDIDLCISFANDPSALNSEKVAENMRLVANLLKYMPGMKIVDILENARVPLIKLQHIKTNLDVDISFHISQSVMISKTIQVYYAIDPRALVLGCLLKKLTKSLDISTTVRCAHNSMAGRDLSQYAYVITMIYYLQQTSPPVLPVIQELGYEGCVKDDRLSKICGAWPGHQQNKSSVGELWLGFLDFYTEGLFTERFDSENLVVCIDQLEPLSKVNIGWDYSSCIAIQDPGNCASNIGDIPLLNYLKMKTVFVNAKTVLEKAMEESNLDVMENYFESIRALSKGNLSRPDYERSLVKIPQAISPFVEYKPIISAPAYFTPQQSPSLDSQSSILPGKFVICSSSNWKEYKDSLEEKHDIMNGQKQNLHKNTYKIPLRFKKTTRTFNQNYRGSGDIRDAFKINNAKRKAFENCANNQMGNNMRKQRAKTWKEFKQMSDKKEKFYTKLDQEHKDTSWKSSKQENSKINNVKEKVFLWQLDQNILMETTENKDVSENSVKNQRAYKHSNLKEINADLSMPSMRKQLEGKQRSDFDKLLKENGIYYK